MIERTLSIAKPDAVRQHRVGEIIRFFESGGLHLVAAKFIHLSQAEAGRFYSVHQDKPFYGSLTEFMSSGPIMPMVLEGENAIARVREIMGSTDPKKAAPTTIRAAVGTDVEKNAVHGSDAPETARWEIAFFFGQLELHEY